MNNSTHIPTTAVTEPPQNGDAELRRLLNAIALQERKLRRRRIYTVVCWILFLLVVVASHVALRCSLSQDARLTLTVIGVVLYAVFGVAAVASTIVLILQSRALTQQRILSALQELNRKVSQLLDTDSDR